MARKVIDNYPHYLKEFDEIQAIANTQQSTLSELEFHTKNMLDDIRLARFAAERWVEVLEWDATAVYSTDGKKFFRRHQVTDLEELKAIISCWIDEEKFNLSYDSETMVFTLRTTVLERDVKKKKIRAAIPCNMDIRYEFVKEL